MSGGVSNLSANSFSDTYACFCYESICNADGVFVGGWEKENSCTRVPRRKIRENTDDPELII